MDKDYRPIEPDYEEEFDDDDYRDEDDFKDAQFEEDCERAATCKCGAWQFNKKGMPVHIADCICGAE